MQKLDLQQYVDAALKHKSILDLKPLLQPCDLAEVIIKLPRDIQLEVLQQIPMIDAAKAIEYLEPELQYRILHHLSAPMATPVLRQMSSDSITDMLLAIHPLQAEKLLQLFPKNYRKKIKDLMTYPNHTAGGRATADYLVARAFWTSEQTISYLRKRGQEAEIISYVYVTSSRGELVGVASLKEIILADPQTSLESLCKKDVIFVPAMMEQEEAATILSRYGFYALPVVDCKNRLIGILTYDDVADVLSDEATEDFQKLGGSQPLHKPYLQTSVVQLFKSRIPWLLFLFIGGSFTAKVLNGYQDVLSRHIALSFFLTLLIGTGGNTGSQIVNTVVRALGVGEIKFSDLWRVVRKECVSGLLLGSCLSLISCLLTYYFTAQFVGQDNILYVVPLSTLAIVLWSSFVSSILPLFLHRLRFDPAVISGPLISTLVDGTGLMIYFNIARFVLDI